MRYVLFCWKHENEMYKIAHDFREDYTVKEVASWMRDQMGDEDYPTFAFEAITKEQYEWYARRKLTTANFG